MAHTRRRKTPRSAARISAPFFGRALTAAMPDRAIAAAPLPAPFRNGVSRNHPSGRAGHAVCKAGSGGCVMTRFHTVVVALDFSDSGDDALDAALALTSADATA